MDSYSIASLNFIQITYLEPNPNSFIIISFSFFYEVICSYLYINIKLIIIFF